MTTAQNIAPAPARSMAASLGARDPRDGHELSSWLCSAANRARLDSQSGPGSSELLRETNREICKYISRISETNRDRIEKIRRDAVRSDAITNPYTSATLRYIETEIFKTEFAPLFYREVLGPCIVSVPEGYRDYLWRQTTSVGEAKAIANSTDDAPSVDMFLAEFHQRFQAYGVSYGYSAMDLESDRVGQLPITVEAGMDCVDRMERRFDNIARNGDSLYQLSGFFNYPDVPVSGTTAGYTALSATNWKTLARGSDANKSTLISVFGDFLRQILDGTQNVERGPFVVVVDVELWFLLANTPRSSLDGTMLMNVLKQNPLCQDIVFWPELSTAGVSGASRAIAFTRDPRKLKYLEMVRFKSMPPREKGSFGWEVPNYGISGGVIMPKPRAMLYLDLT